jgi:23S rRNA (guanosine2251-2'-O)-methyltransferase
MREQTKKREHTERSDLIVGRNAVLEALKAKRNIDVLYLQEDLPRQGSFARIFSMAKENRVVIKTVAAQKLNALSGGVVHQGVIAQVSAAEYVSLEDLLSIAKEKGEPPFLIICDEIEDPHNLGAIIRTAEAAGAHGVIIPKRRSATVTQVVYKTSAGAAGVLPICRVSNLKQAVDTLKKQQVWIYAADMDGSPWCEVDYSGGVALIVGSEGKGISKLMKEEADFIVSLPMRGQINSLNASVAAGILMYEVTRQCLGLKLK